MDASFDRAVDYYDRTRALTPAAMEAAVRILAAELRARGPVLEIGIGTGRMALPLSEEGVRMAGIDVSHSMLLELVRKAGGAIPFPLARADARALPFVSAAFGAVLAVHVLHLIPDWAVVVDEAARVAPGGVFVMAYVASEQGIWREAINVFRDAAGLPPSFPGATDPAPVDERMRGRGAGIRDLDTVVEHRHHSPADILDRLAGSQFSFTWSLSDDARSRGVARVEGWARERFGDLDAGVPNEAVLGWRAYDLPG